MAVTRITQNMLSQRSLGSLQSGLGKLSKIQEQLSTGRVINRPSDSPTGTTSAMRLRSGLGAVQQYQTNAQDGLGWLGTVDSALTSVSDQVRQARDLGLQGASSGSMDATSREALAAQLDQLRTSLISEANTSYLDRPVFGGITAGSEAYDSTGAYVGQAGAVMRTVGDGVRVRVDADARAVFGADGDNVFDHIDALSNALRSGDQTAIGTNVDALTADLNRLAGAHAEVGTRMARVDQAQSTAADRELSLKNSLSEVENADLPSVIVDLQLQQTAYQAALGATARVMQPSLMDFLK
jgi:flagellar hook-associated protein 3 FlgL